MTNWVSLWQELVTLRDKSFNCENGQPFDYWKENAQKFAERVRERWRQPDTTRDFLVKIFKENPGSTLLDIGAGTGNWAFFLAPYLRSVTAIEPSAGMRAVFLAQQKELGTKNVRLIAGAWPETQAEKHDFVLCSHAMYAMPDLVTVIRQMQECAGKVCFLLIRAPLASDPLAILSQRIWGQPHDSPNFTVLYNALLTMGIHANVLFEERQHPHPKVFDSLEVAFQSIRERFRLPESDTRFDREIREMLAENLFPEEDHFRLNMRVKVALVYWKPIMNHFLLS